MGRPDKSPACMRSGRNLPAGKPHPRPPSGPDVAACRCKDPGEVRESGKVAHQDQVMDPVAVLHFCRRNDEDAGIVIEERFPNLPPGGKECIAAPENREPLTRAGSDQVLRPHRPG